MPSRFCEFVDSRLRRSLPDGTSAVPYGQAGENAMRFPHLAHRSAAAHKLHSTPQQDGIDLISGNDQTSSRLPAFSLSFPGSCPNNPHRRKQRCKQFAMTGVALFVRVHEEAPGIPRQKRKVPAILVWTLKPNLPLLPAILKLRLR